MRPRPAFTLIEMLAVSTACTLGAALLFSGADAARRAAAKAVAMDNMKFQGEFAHMNAGEDPSGILHAAHSRTNEDQDLASTPGGLDSRAYAMGAGDWDWGGKDGIRTGTQIEFAPASSSDGLHRGADGRFMNRFLNAPGSRAGFEIFKDPGDCGLDPEATSAPSPTTPSNEFSTSVFSASGNSYMGDFYYLKDHYWDTIDGGPYRRWGAYRRSVEQFPEVGRALLFWESRFIQALANTEEIGVGATTLGSVPRNITGWHGDVGEFLATFADGHTAMIECKRQGSLTSPRDFRDGQNVYWRLHWRSANWRYDNFPAPMVKRSWFAPLLSYSDKRLSAWVRGL